MEHGYLLLNLIIFYMHPSLNILRVIKPRMMRWKSMQYAWGRTE
jgi:hypothetical protein